VLSKGEFLLLGKIEIDPGPAQQRRRPRRVFGRVERLGKAQRAIHADRRMVLEPGPGAMRGKALGHGPLGRPQQAMAGGPIGVLFQEELDFREVGGRLVVFAASGQVEPADHLAHHGVFRLAGEQAGGAVLLGFDLLEGGFVGCAVRRREQALPSRRGCQRAACQDRDQDKTQHRSRHFNRSLYYLQRAPYYSDINELRQVRRIRGKLFASGTLTRFSGPLSRRGIYCRSKGEGVWSGQIDRRLREPALDSQSDCGETPCPGRFSRGRYPP
jgi:hypothetical protein